mgnify:CR=1 FL=1|tara:strand:- start:2441 stop:2680 length:240 start_codon:yes stop_codon:yes gene_type:complete
MQTNPSANLYAKFDNFKKFTRDLEAQETKTPTKGLLSRNMSMKKNMKQTKPENDPFSEAMDFFEAIQNERLNRKEEIET